MQHFRDLGTGRGAEGLAGWKLAGDWLQGSARLIGWSRAAGKGAFDWPERRAFSANERRARPAANQKRLFGGAANERRATKACSSLVDWEAAATWSLHGKVDGDWLVCTGS